MAKAKINIVFFILFVSCSQALGAVAAPADPPPVVEQPVPVAPVEQPAAPLPTVVAPVPPAPAPSLITQPPPVDPPATVDLDEPDYVSLRIEVKSVNHLREGQHYNPNGLTSVHNQFHAIRPHIQISNSEDGRTYTDLARNSWITLGTSQTTQEAFSVCRTKSFESLKNSAYFVISAQGIPFAALYNSPVDWNDMHRLNREAKGIENQARAQMKREDVNHKDIVNQIAVAKKALASTTDSKRKSSLSSQIANLEKRAKIIYDRAQQNFKNSMANAAKLKERANRLAKKISEELVDTQTRIEKNMKQVADLKARIAKSNDLAVIEKLKIQLLMVQDRLDKNNAELAQMRPGLKHHISLNLAKYSVQCE